MNKLVGRFGDGIYRLLAGLCLLGALLVLLLPWGRPRYDFTLTFLDVGQGDAIVISADGCNVLVDGGGLPADAVGMAERVVLPYLKANGIERLDLVVNSHPDNDHIGGLFAVIDTFRVDKLAVFAGYGENELQEQLLALAAGREVAVQPLAAGDKLVLSDSFSIEVTWPKAGAEFGLDSVNGGSLVLHIKYDDFDVLLTGDLAGEGLYLSSAGLEQDGIEVLQLPHHGSGNSYDEAWYEQFAPLAVLISVGRDNVYGHPGAQVVEYWQERAVPVLRTDELGAFRVVYHRGEVWFEQAR